MGGFHSLKNPEGVSGPEPVESQVVADADQEQDVDDPSDVLSDTGWDTDLDIEGSFLQLFINIL